MTANLNAEPVFYDPHDDDPSFPSIPERVTAGWDYLDRCVPGWQERVNPETLDLANGCSCICGQVFADDAARTKGVCNGFDYWCESGFYRDALFLLGDPTTYADALLGFGPTWPPFAVEAEYAALTVEWRTRLLAWRAAQPA